MLLGLAIAGIGGAVLATVFWTTGLIDGEYIAGLQDRFDTARSGPGVALAMLIAFAIGTSMVVLPCGFPAVFAVPTLLEATASGPRRLRLLGAFALGGVIPLALAGLALGWAGGGLWELLDSARSRQLFAAVTYSALGAFAVIYALTEFEILHARGPLERVIGPALPGAETATRRSLALGATFGAGMGIACPMPTYYALIGWVVVAASGWYGALVLGAYGLGRMLVPIVLGLLIVAGASRRAVAQRMAAAHSRVQWGSGLVMAALGVFMITLFGGFLGASLL